jgi:hypothetical protein
MRLPSRRHARPIAPRRTGLVAGILATLAGGLLTAISVSPAQAADATVTSFAVASDAGDYIGGGQSRSYAPPGATFRIQGTAGSVRVSIDAGTEWWDVTLAAPAGGQLSPGTYQNAARAPFNGAVPGLSVTGTGRGCNTVKGFFDVTALSVDAHGQVTTLDASFTQFCDASTGALRGSIRYAAPPDGDVVLSSANPTSVEGQPVLLSAKVRPGTGGGVTFLDGSTVLGSSSAANAGVAKWGIESPAVGTHTFTAIQGATTSTPKTSAPVTQTVLPGGTSLYFRSGNGDSIGQGATASFAAPGAAITAHALATGIVRVFVVEGDERWSVDLAAPPGQPLVPGSYAGAERASFRTAGHPGLDVSGDGRGCNTLTGSFTVAQISFDAAGELSTLDASWVQNCEGGPVAMTGRVRVGASTVLASTTTLTATAQVGGATTMTATVTGAGTTPTGQVTFTDGSATVGTATLDATGRAVLTATLTRGAHALGASYGGSPRYAPSQTGAPLTVLGYATVTSLSTGAKGNVKAGKPVSLSVAVSGGGSPPAGVVAFFDGADQVATGLLSGGKATVSWTPGVRGTHTLTAQYLGDGSHEPSTSTAVSVRVT